MANIAKLDFTADEINQKLHAVDAIGETINEQNKKITTLNGTDTGKSVREIAREEAYKVETAAMEFMGTVSELPKLKEVDKGHVYKVLKDIDVSDSNFIFNKNITKTFKTNKTRT